MKTKAKRFLKKFPSCDTVNREHNEDRACPACGSRDEFRIEVKTSIVMSDSGSIDDPDNGDQEWTDRSLCACLSCGHEGTVAKFHFEGLDAELESREELEEKPFEAMLEAGTFETNSIDPNASWCGCAYETFGEELARVQHVATQHPNRIATILEADGKFWVTKGFHHVNRFAYLIAKADLPDFQDMRA